MKNWQEYTAFEWLLIDVASRFGMDKELNHKRIEWAAGSILPLIEMATDMQDLKLLLAPYIDEADEQSMFVGACIAVWDTVNGQVSTWQVGQDAASSGPALLSTLLKDTVGMQYCGVTGEDVPDLYTSVTKAMNDSKYDRKIVKKGIIPHVYASEVEPKKVFGTAYPKFLKAYKSIVRKAQEASDFMVKAWNPNATEHVFTMPDGAVIRIPVIVQNKKTLPCGKHSFVFIYDEIGSIKRGDKGTKSLSANTTHAYDAYILRELNRRCNYDTALVTRCIKLLERREGRTETELTDDKLLNLEGLYYTFKQPSAVALEYIDEANVHWISDAYASVLLNLAKRILRDKPFEVSNIHDEFKSLPNYSCALKHHYNILMVETYMSDWWVETAHTLTGMDVTFMANTIDPSVIPLILKAPYSIG